MDTKRCSKCLVVKPTTEFYSNATGVMGVRGDCKECVLLARAARHKKNKSIENAKNAERRRAEPEKSRLAIKRWAKLNPDKVREAQKRWREKRAGSLRARLDDAISSGVRRGLLRGSKAGRRSYEILGFTHDDLRRHLERLFQPGMTWDNYGQWHIDHKIPLSVHNYETPDNVDFKRAWALSNLQPMWAKTNRVKSAKLSAPFQPSLML